MNQSGLCLDLSLGSSLEKEQFQAFDNTYRGEGLTLSNSTFRLFGQEFISEVSYDDLEIGRKIGQGACSSVNIGIHHDTREKYAVKMFNVYDDDQASQLSKEISVLAQIQCDALVAMKGAFHRLGSIGLILEYMDRGSLEFLLDPAVRLDEITTAAIAYQILWGLGYLHFDHRLHRDIKPANVLINSCGYVKLSDFGISRELSTSTGLSGTVVGTFRYMSPERLLGEDYDYTSDIWSVGILLIHLWNKCYPFEDVSSTPIDLLSELEHIDLSLLVSRKRFSSLMRVTILAMLALRASDRPTCVELSESDWFTDCGIKNLNAAHECVRIWLEEFDQQKRISPSTRRSATTTPDIINHHIISSSCDSPRFTVGPNPNHVRRDRIRARLAPHEQRNILGSQASSSSSHRHHDDISSPSVLSLHSQSTAYTSSCDYSSADQSSGCHIRRFSPKYEYKENDDDYLDEYDDEPFDDDVDDRHDDYHGYRRVIPDHSLSETNTTNDSYRLSGERGRGYADDDKQWERVASRESSSRSTISSLSSASTSYRSYSSSSRSSRK